MVRVTCTHKKITDFSSQSYMIRNHPVFEFSRSVIAAFLKNGYTSSNEDMTKILNFNQQKKN